MDGSRLHSFGKINHILLGLGLLLALAAVPPPAVNAACNKKPAKPQIQIPRQSAALNTRRVDLGWKATDCATRYQVEIRQGSEWGRPWDANYNLTDTKYRTRKLEKGRSYWWHVEACNPYGCKVSKWGSFTITK